MGNIRFSLIPTFSGYVSQNSRTATVAALPFLVLIIIVLFQHTATRRWLRITAISNRIITLFQHTATRRWLQYRLPLLLIAHYVSTHSHPKVAASVSYCFLLAFFSFNTQPPEGGCTGRRHALSSIPCFNTQPPEGGCQPPQILQQAQ